MPRGVRANKPEEVKDAPVTDAAEQTDIKSDDAVVEDVPAADHEVEHEPESDHEPELEAAQEQNEEGIHTDEATADEVPAAVPELPRPEPRRYFRIYEGPSDNSRNWIVNGHYRKTGVVRGSYEQVVCQAPGFYRKVGWLKKI